MANLWENISKSATQQDALTVLLKVLKKAEEEWPGSLSLFSQQCAKVSGAGDECQRCCSLVSGLSKLQAFQGAKLSTSNRTVQHQVDCLIRSLVSTREESVRLGYPMGDIRWRKAGCPDETINPGGRPSKVNCEETIKMVQDALDSNSQPSSSVCQKGETWSVVNALTSNPTAVFQKEAAIHSEISIRTRILRRHLVEYKTPRTLTDWCQHCAHLEDSVLPEIRKAMKHWQDKLSCITPCYFEDWDSFVALTGLNFEDQPGLYLSELEHFIKLHCESKPCRKHAGSGSLFPCGKFDLRKRGSGFPQKSRLELHNTEAAASYELHAHLKLLLGYLHHRAAKETQHAAITKLLENPPVGMACLLSDWKELETLPQCFKATGDQFFAQARHEISVWGALLCEHSDTSTSEKPEIMQTYIVVVSKILDHTALRTNQLIRIALKVKKSKKPWSSLALISDCGPHYRSMESLAHGLVYLHNAYDRIPIEIHFGCEKHMKSSIDRLFGWTKAILRRTVAGQKDLLEIEDVVTALRAGFAQNKKDNPAGPNVVVGLDDSPVPPLSQILSVKSKNFKISRSYCLSSAPSKLRPAEPRIFNHTFSSKPAAEEIDYELEQGEVPSAWRRGFWSASKSAWADKPKPLYPNEENTLSRRFLAQKHLLPSVLERRRQLLPDFAEEARRRQKRLNRARAAARARKDALAKATDSSSNSSSGSSSSSSDSA